MNTICIFRTTSELWYLYILIIIYNLGQIETCICVCLGYRTKLFLKPYREISVLLSLEMYKIFILKVDVKN